MSKRFFPLAVLSAAFLLAACNGSDPATETTLPTTTTIPSTTTSSTSSTTTSSTTSSTSSTSSTTTTTLAPDPIMFDIAYADGAVDGPTRPEVAVGTRVTLLVTSDVDDDVYLHGYNVKAAVGLDTAAVIEFLADEPGTYELELLDADVSLLEIAVR